LTHIVSSPGDLSTRAADYVSCDPGRGFGGLRDGFTIGGFSAQTAQVHLTQPQIVRWTHTAVDPRAHAGGFPLQGSGGQSLAAAVSAPNRTPMANAAVAAMMTIKNLA
jgi:hypothetical protein